MTLHTFSHDRKQNTPLSYFRFLARQNWPALVTNTILFLLLNGVIMSMVVSEFTYSDSLNRLFELMVDTARTMRVFNVVLSSLLAVLWGSSALSFVNSKVSVHFYHSIPLRRDTLYIEEILVKLLMFTVPCALTNVLAVCINGLTTGYWYGRVTAMYLGSIGYSVLYFCFFLSIMVFCASFTGNAFSRLMSAGLVVAMPAALVACMVTILEFEANYSRYDHFLNFALKILPPARILMFFLEVEELSTTAVREIIGTLLVTAAFFAAGYLIYRKRKSELSGQPVLSKIASGLIKYTCMFCAAALFGLIFYVFVDSYIWYCVGAVIGALLIMMLINVILTKSAKQMFQGISGMGIFSVAFVAFFICFGVDAVGYDRYVPSAAMTKSLTIEVGGEVTLPVEKEEDEKFFLSSMQRYLKDPDAMESAASSVREYSYAYDYDDLFADYVNDEIPEAELEYYRSYLREVFVELYHSRQRVTIRMTIQPHFGLAIVKYVHVDPMVFADFLDCVANSENFADEYFPDTEHLRYSGSLPDITHAFGRRETELKPEQMNALLEEIKASYNGAAYFQRSTVDAINIHAEDTVTGRYVYSRIPYYNMDTKSYDEYLATVACVFVMDRETEEMKEYRDPAEIRTICDNLCFYGNGINSSFTHEDPRYVVAVVGDDWDSQKRGLTNYLIGAFLRERVPDFIQ